jgi:putative membrane protein
MGRLLVLFTLGIAACSHTAIEAARQDAALMEAIARANLAEIAAGNLAVRKAHAPQVRQFGERVVDEHSALLKGGAGLAGVAVPTTPGARHEPALKQLESLSGESFDRAFMAQMVLHHKETLQLLDQAAVQAADPQLRAHAQRAIPHVERHLAQALQMK